MSATPAIFRDTHAQLPLSKMIGLRNVIAHGYADVDYHRLYRVATVEVPAMNRILESLLPEDS